MSASGRSAPRASRSASRSAAAEDGRTAGSLDAGAPRRDRALRLIAWGAILLVAVTLRFRNLGWGTEPVYDEVIYWRVQLYSFLPFDAAKLFKWSLFYPTFFGYLAGATVGAAHHLGYLPRPFANYLGVVTVARGVSAAAGVVSVLLIGALARRLESRRAGLLAAAFLAVVPIEATQPHYVSVDVLQNCSVILALIAGCVLIEREGHAWALLGGMAAGFAFGTKYSGVAALAAPGWAALEVGFRRRSLLRTITLGTAALAGFAAGVLGSCPPCVLNYQATLEALRFHTSVSFSSGASSYGANLSPRIGWYARPYLYQLLAGLPFVMGWPLYALSLLGVAAAVVRRRPTDRLVLVTLLAFFVVVAGSPIVFPRYLLPVVPGLVLCAALLVARRSPWRPALVLVAAAVWIYGFALSWSLVSRSSHDQQTAIAAWARDQGARCAGEGGELHVGYPAGPYFGLSNALAKTKVRHGPSAIGRWFDPPPDVFLLPEWLAINIDLERLDQNDALAADLARLRAPDGPYEPVARWSSSYLQKGFYTWLDPSFDATLEQGEIGFTAYAKKSLSCVERRLPRDRTS